MNGPAWLKDDGTLDESAVTEYLTQANRIYQAGKEGVDALNRMMEEAGMSVSYLSDTDMDLLKELSGSAMSLLSGAYNCPPEDLPLRMRWRLSPVWKRQTPVIRTRCGTVRQRTALSLSRLWGSAPKPESRRLRRNWWNFCSARRGREQEPQRDSCE